MTHKFLTALLFASSLTLSQARELSVFSDLPEDDAAFNLTTTYNTRYWNEGRDYLENDDLWASSFNYAWESLTAGIWYAKSTEVTYEELQLGVAWRHDLTDTLQMYVGYAFIDYIEQSVAVGNVDDDDNEFSFGLTYTGCPWGIVGALDVYYSDDAEGFFAEGMLSREWQINDKWSTHVAGVLGMNQGYIADGSDGLNHFGVVAGFSYKINDCLTFGLEGVQSYGINRDDPGDIDTDDFLHGRASLTWSF